MRTAEALGRIFAKSGLTIAYKTKETSTHDNFVPVTIWLLEKANKKTVKQKMKTDNGEDDGDSVDSNGYSKNLDTTKNYTG